MMTINRDKKHDREETKNLIRNPNRNKYAGGKNWLGHGIRGGKDAYVDEMLINGVTMEEMLKQRGAIYEHLNHLRVEHGLLYEKLGDIYRFSRLDLGIGENDVKEGKEQHGVVSNNLNKLASPNPNNRGLDGTSPLTFTALPSPNASDINAPPGREEITTYRIIRDTNLSKKVKALHRYKCQLCDYSMVLPDGSYYAEAHHIRPLGNPHNGPDVVENILCLCPNHHAELDYGVYRIEPTDLTMITGHVIGADYINYHNANIYGGP
jgi:hypothetical protein